MDPREHALQEETYALISDTLGIEKSSIQREQLITDLSPDSIRLFELLLTFEKHYGIIIP